MAGSVGGATSDSWKAADLDAAMSKLIISKPNNGESSSNSTAASPAPSTSSSGGVLEDSVDSVDQFLREALQNPRERLSVLRMEQDVEKFIRDPSQQQMEFSQLPTSYLRLAAHRVAQHYSLQSMVLMDNNLSDSSASRIIVCKTSECRRPLIRLADIPVNLPTEDPSSSVVRVAIKQRPDKRSQVAGGADSNSSSNSSKSMEERKEDYNRARARIFSSSSSRVVSNGTQESGPRMLEALQNGSLGTPKVEDDSVPRAYVNIGRGSADSFTGSSKSARGRTEKEPTSRSRSNSRVAIFRDHEVERKDPDYNRSYGRYVQSSDPGYGFNGGSYPIRPIYAPVLSHSTEFLQHGSAHRSPIYPSQTLPQHLPGPWVAPSLPVGIGYGPPEAMMNVFGPNHAAPHSASTLYMHYPYQQPGMTFIHPYQQVHQHFAQSLQPPSGASFGLARPR